MYLIYNLARYSVQVNEATKLLEIDRSKVPLPYTEAVERATRSATSDSEKYSRRAAFTPMGTRIGETGAEPDLYK
jgi:hypothetical protein